MKLMLFVSLFFAANFTFAEEYICNASFSVGNSSQQLKEISVTVNRNVDQEIVLGNIKGAAELYIQNTNNSLFLFFNGNDGYAATHGKFGIASLNLHSYWYDRNNIRYGVDADCKLKI